MKLKLVITKANGTDIIDKKVIPINHFLHPMIKQMSIKMNNTLVTQLNDTYGYKAYKISLLSYPKDSAESYVRCGTRMQRGSLISWKQPVGRRV